jgi:cellulose synthase/poly-beta-1,6-N-acetylglucosamine synthase-like glycosyltransferase
LGVLLVGYTYVGYGMIIYILAKFSRHSKPVKSLTDAALPNVSLIIAAYNEEDFIREKIANTLALNYPLEKLEIIVVTDGSSDRTPEIVAEFSQITLYHSPERLGKIHAVNRVMKFIENPITIFCDANTNLNADAIRNIVRHYQDETVGGVAGEKRIFSKDKDNASGSGEGMYWKYESFLKKKDAEVYSIVGAAGELFSIRTRLYEAPDTNMIIEDFYMSMRITTKGFRFAYEPESYAIETASASVKEEWKRKVRISAGAFQAMGKLLYLLNPFQYGVLSFQYISHRVLRWTLAPLFLPIVFFTSLYLANLGSTFYQLALVLQVLFYGLALAGYSLREQKIGIKGFFVPYYFMVMNVSVYAGFVRHLKGRQSVLWEKAQRATT